MKKNLSVYTDGGSRGNPGPSAVGVIIKNQDEEIIFKSGKYIGETTNNVAEYTAVITALEWLVENNTSDQINFYSDSLLIVNQLKGIYRIKDKKLIALSIRVKGLEKIISSKIIFHYLVRENNKLADALVNKTLDENPS